VLGDLAAVASLASAPTATGEISILGSRSLARQVVSPPVGDDVPRPGIEGYERRLGLTTLVRDEGLTPFSLLRRRYLGGAPPGQPPVHPDGRLFATMVRKDDSPDSGVPSVVRVEFLTETSVRLTSPSLRSRLRLDDDYPRERDFTPGESIAYRDNDLRLVPEGDYVGRSFLVERLPEYLAVDRLRLRISVGETARNSGVIRVTVSDTDPWRAAATANALCANYLDDLDARTSKRATETVEYVKGLLEEEQAAYEAALEEILELRADHPETLDLGAAATTLVSRLSSLELQRLRLEINRHSLSAVVAALKEGDATALGRLDSAITARFVVDPLTEALLVEIARVEGIVQRQEARYQEDAPTVLEATETLHELEKRVLGQLETRLAGYAEEDETLRNEYARVEAELSSLPANELALARPLLRIRAHEEILPALVRSLQSAEIARNASQPSAQYVDSAEPPTRIEGPRFGLALAGGVVLGLLLGALVVFLAEPRRARPSTAEELEDAAGLAVRGVVPRFRGPSLRPRVRGRAIPLRDAPDHPAAEAYRTLEAGLAAGAADEGRILGVTSTLRGEGRSTANVDLAIALAQAGKRTLLVDADLRRPAVHTLFALPAAPGLAEHAEGGDGWRALVHETEHPGLHVLPAGTPKSSPGECLASARVRAMLEESREEFDAIVLDLPPARRIADVFLLGGSLDEVVLLCKSGGVPRRELVACAEGLERGGVRVVGAVLNAASV